MTAVDLVSELIRIGDQILRIPKPPLRQRQWRKWRDQVVNNMREISALNNIGLQLKVNYLAADIGILSRYLRLMTDQPDIAAEIAISKGGKKSGKKRRSPSNLLTNKEKIRIFISHKHEDERTAVGVKSAIERYGAGSVEIFLSEDIPSGTNWIKWIKKRLSESNILILIFTDATRTWDWPLYEAGLFTKLDELENQTLICLHSENLKPPPPLRHLQAVPAQIPKVTNFLKELFIEAKLKGMSKPLNLAMAEQPEELERAASEIVDLISRRRLHTDYFAKYLFINIGYLEEGKIPSDSKIVSNASTFEMFGLKKGDWVWKDIVTQAKKVEDQRWLNELVKAIAEAIDGQLFTPIQATLKSYKESKRYLPLLYRVDTLADGSHLAKILFNEDVSWHISDIPKTLGFLSTALIMSVRFRYEVLQKYEGKHIHCRNQRDKNKLKRELVQSLKNIEMESSSRGLLDENELINVFSNRDDKLQIKKMYDSWYLIRKILFSRKKQKDDLIEKQLNELFELNNEFITMGMKRFCELLTQER